MRHPEAQPAPLVDAWDCVKRWCSFSSRAPDARVGVATSSDSEPRPPAGRVRQVIIDAVSLQFLPYQLRGLTFGAVGVLLVAVGAYRARGR